MTGVLVGKIALVTGASRGIGRAVALRYAAEGAHVVALARTRGGLEELDDAVRACGGTATLVPFDLRETEAIDTLGPSLLARFGRLDVLVGNAAVLGALTPLPHLEPAVMDEVFRVNVTANWRLIRILDPLLRASPAGRAIFVTSGAAQAGAPFWGHYAASKSALEAMVRAYAAETRATPLRVNLIGPAQPVRTAMRAFAFPGEDAATLPPPDAITEAFVLLASDACRATGQHFAAPVTEWPPGTRH